jgi:hypothetical protein
LWAIKGEVLLKSRLMANDEEILTRYGAEKPAAQGTWMRRIGGSEESEGKEEKEKTNSRRDVQVFLDGIAPCSTLLLSSLWER